MVNFWSLYTQGMARMCCDTRKSVRQTAITYLQRALLAHELQNLTSSEWEACFLQVRQTVCGNSIHYIVRSFEPDILALQAWLNSLCALFRLKALGHDIRAKYSTDLRYMCVVLHNECLAVLCWFLLHAKWDWHLFSALSQRFVRPH